MKYLQHETNARNDVKMKQLRRRYGLTGYGVYFIMLEIIGENVRPDNVDEWGFVDKFHNVETLTDEVNLTKQEVTPETFKEILTFCNELDLFQKKNDKLFCKQILKRLDEYSQIIKRNEARRNKLGDKKGTKKSTTPDILPMVSGENRVEEKRIEKNKREENKISPVENNGLNDVIIEDDKERTFTDDPIVEYCREQQGIDKRFINYGKQLNHLKRIRQEYPDDEDTKFVIEEMAAEKYWKENPFDMADVANNMYKYMNREVKYDVPIPIE